MHADVERFGHDPGKRFLRVIEQQGRVRLAADGNQQAAILLDYLRELATDLIGPFGTPASEDNSAPGDGFEVTRPDSELTIARGRYWVDGYLCVNDDPVPYDGQPDFPEAPQLPEKPYLVYLDVWERHVSAAQDPSIREVALGGPDTCSRSKLVWQVRTAVVSRLRGRANAARLSPKQWEEWRDAIDPPNRGQLTVDVARDGGPPDPCQVPADAGYYGNENQLYRVEIHRGSGRTTDGVPLPATFKWSRDNGSVHYPLAGIEGTVAVLLDPPLDCAKQLTPGTLVELVDDHSELLARPGIMARVVEVDDDGDDVVVRLSAGPAGTIAPERHPMLRRWDHPDVEGSPGGAAQRADDGALELLPGNDYVLEDGIVVRFGDENAQFRTGDYWTFPARAATGDVIWPRDATGKGMPVAPHGVRHHLAPLAFVNGNTITDLRVGFPRLAVLFS